MVILYGITIALSAALIFLVQPMFAQFVLPLLRRHAGGLEHLDALLPDRAAGRLPLRARDHAPARASAARRCCTWRWSWSPLVVLPIGVPDGRPPPARAARCWALLGAAGGRGRAAVLRRLDHGAAAPALARRAPTTPPPRDPYFLYRASNLGSVIGLLAYPLLIEPALRLDGQGVAVGGRLRGAGAAPGRRARWCCGARAGAAPARRRGRPSRARARPRRPPGRPPALGRRSPSCRRA